MANEKTLTGLDKQTLTFLGDFYEKVFIEEVERLLDSVILFHADPSAKNFYTVKHRMDEVTSNMTRRNVFKTHNQ